MRDYKEYTIMDAKADTGVGKAIFVGDAKHIEVFVATASSANGTVKFQGSIAGSVPDFAAAQTAANQWDYVLVKDLEDGSSLDGDTGLAPAGTDDFRMFEVNTNALNWFSARITAIAAGNFTVKIRIYNE